MKFFHKSTIRHRRYNAILGLQDDCGQWKFSHEDIHYLIFSFFNKTFTSSKLYVDLTPLPLLPHTTISPQDISLLLQPPSTMELYNVVMDFHPLKAPGPDVLNPIFFQKFWHLTNTHFLQVVQDFFSHGNLSPSVNTSPIVLIPKNTHPESIKHFRPISLCNTIYKIISKIFVHRLRPILCSIISPFQSSFLPCRRTSDNILITQGILEYMNKPTKRKCHFMAIKIDLEKAFDSLEWDFLQKVSDFFGFPKAFSKLVMSCLCTSSYCVLINGKPSCPIFPSRGVRQGDPLSPYLFILAIEYLSLLISHNVQLNLWNPIQINSKAPKISHLLFEDDIILFAKADTHNAIFISNILKDFSELSSLNINYTKSTLTFSKSPPHCIQTKFTVVLHIRAATDLSRYLGTPLSCKKLKAKDLTFS